MYQRISFLEYLQKHDLTFLEMAQVSPEKKIVFDKNDLAYLQHFQPKSVNLWMNAIMKRYSPMVLNYPDQDNQDFTIETQIEDPETKKRIQKRYVFRNVPTFAKELIAKLDEHYDISKINLNNNSGRTAARKAATMALEWEKDPGSVKPPALNLNNALKPESKTTRKQPFSAGAGSTTMKRSVSTDEPVVLDTDDKEFLDWFDVNNVVSGKGKVRPAKEFKLTALTKRYSRVLVNDPQANQPSGENNEAGVFYDIPFRYHQAIYIAKGVPVNAQRLKKRLDDLREKGIDFYAVPLHLESARMWLKNPKHEYKPNRGQAGTKQGAERSIGKKSFDSIKDYIEKQDAYLRDPEENAPPTIWDGERLMPKSIDFDENVPWMDILRQEAEVAAKRSYYLLKNRLSGNSINKITIEDLQSDIWTFLTTEKTVSNPEYQSQKWRIMQGTRFGIQHAKEQIGFGRKEQGIVQEPEKAAADIDQPSVISPQMQMLINQLQQSPEAAYLPADTNWPELGQEFLRMYQDYRDDNGMRHPSPTELRLIMSQLLTPLLPAVAAQKPTKAKLNEPPKYDPGQSTGAYSYGKPDEPEEDYRKYRRKF